MSRGVFLLEFAHPLQELLSPSLLEHAHQGGAQSFTRVGGHLRHRSLGSLALLDIAAGNLLKFQVSCDIGGDQDIRQLAVGHQELRDQIDVPVVDTTIFLPRFLAGGNVAVFLEQLQRSSLLVTSNNAKLYLTDLSTHRFDIHGRSLAIERVSGDG